MKVVVENHIPFIRGILEKAGHSVEYLDPGSINPAAVKDADALIVRTRTRCDRTLLEGSRVGKVITATIGTDHIDLDYCRSRGITVANAPGCNAPAVAQYVLSSIAALNYRPESTVIGIVGVGNVGSIVDRWARANGFRTLLCDPPRHLPATLADIAAEADVITFHTPLDASTHHMADRGFFNSCARKPLIINAARGSVVSTSDLIDAIASGQVANAVIDCWEGEPLVNKRLLNLTAIATPHIAGYSLQGKRRATAMAIRALDPLLAPELDPVAQAPAMSQIVASYNPLADSSALKADPASFESLRNHYDYRQEPAEIKD